jgi:WD40 repeat protein
MSGLKRRLRGTLTVQKTFSAVLDESVVGLAWLQGSRLAALTAAGSVWLTDGSAESLRRVGGHAEGGLAIASQPTGSLLATGGQDGMIRLWDSKSGVQTAVIETGTPWVERLAWRPDGSGLAATLGRRVGVWDAAGLLVGRSDEHASTAADIAWQPDGSRIAVAAYGGVTYLAPDGKGPIERVECKGSSLLLAWQPQARYLAVGNQDATVLFVMVESRDTLQMWGFPTKVRSLAWSSDGRWLATGAGSGTVIWDASGAGPKGRTPLTLGGHDGFVTSVAWQPAGTVLASGGSDGQVCLFQPRRRVGRRRRSEDNDQPLDGLIDAEDSIFLAAEITSLAWMNGGSMLAAADRRGTVAVLRIG